MEARDLWDKLRIASGLLASILVPVAIAIVGQSYATAIQESEIRLRYAELAIQILEQRPGEHTQNIRKWAVKVIDEYSSVPMGEDTKNELLGAPILQVEAFMQEKWIPMFLDKVLQAERLRKEIVEVTARRDIEEQIRMIRNIIEGVLTEIDKQRREMLGLPNSVPDPEK